MAHRLNESVRTSQSRRRRGWLVFLVAAVVGAVSTLVGYFVDGDARAMLVGIGLISAIVAVYVIFDIAVFTRTSAPPDLGDAPTFKPEPEAPVTLIHDPGSSPGSSLGRPRGE